MLDERTKGRTESYDEMGDVGADPRWDKFANFHEYLLEAFPLTQVFPPPIPLLWFVD